MPTDVELKNFLAQKAALEDFANTLIDFGHRLEEMHTQISMLNTRFSQYEQQRAMEMASKMGHGSTS